MKFYHVLIILAALWACKPADFGGASGFAGGSKAGGGGRNDDDAVDQNGKDGNDGGEDSSLGGSDGDSDADGDGGADSDTDWGDHPGGTLEEDDDVIKKSLPTFGMLVNDLECGMCHVKVNGDVASTRPVPRLHGPSSSAVNGTWYGASSISLKGQVNASGGFRENHGGVEVPKKFPEMRIKPSLIKGRLVGNDDTVNGVHSGNVVITGTSSNPIEIDGDVYIKGDLVIKGFYKGRGSIYVEGNVYIPFDLRAKDSAFPFPESPSAAAKRGRDLAKGDTDALGIATRKSIFIGDLAKEQPAFSAFATFSIYNGPETPPNKREGPLGLFNVYNWIDGGKDGYRALYGKAYNCLTGANSQTGSFNVVEAFLYAKNTIGGIARTNTYAINGGIIADSFHVIARKSDTYSVVVESAQGCGSPGKHPVHEYPIGWNYVNYDWRIKGGLRILNKLDFGHRGD